VAEPEQAVLVRQARTIRTVTTAMRFVGVSHAGDARFRSPPRDRGRVPFSTRVYPDGLLDMTASAG